MNFKGMPELKWVLGYPFAIVMMVLSAIRPIFVFQTAPMVLKQGK